VLGLCQQLSPISRSDGGVTADRALASADSADGAVSRGEPLGPLHGVPFTVKDTIAAAGIEMAMGAPERVGVVPRSDATAVARVKAAGAILLGKTNCPEYGGGIETDNPVYGRTSNPYDLLVCPVFPGPARLHGTMNVPGELDPRSWTTPHSLTGWPAATVRAGTSPEGLPIDVQLVARPWRDDVALAAGLRVQRELGVWPAPWF
jgi:Asp-tRNA(Asn)/Glu-tRNA(Gln) amidotransferase A subunit family amidase